LLLFACDDALPPTVGDLGPSELGPDAEPDAGLDAGTRDSEAGDSEIPGPKKRVFVTSSRFNGNLGGILGGDAKCETEAQAAQLGGRWKAWISTPAENALQRMADVGPWVLVDGRTQVFVSRAAMIDAPENAIRSGASGDPVNTRVWTGTIQDGTASGHTCQSWTSGFPADFAEQGASSAQDVGWTSTSTETCAGSAALYCFEQ
jgi:hypothetical protein